ncbi:MAG TPA: SDR family NAD(P)-dependent oxidoreductase [Kiritimatiellia bacterium]|nr:SDR family NAD(P)-dependent oxidoreductase [Kiritimatiellia bacterium]HMO98607.1 SDR family NAD(P)-dependent oxidoreductase [Kiritimatiellia bacterium]HMP97850.1 SDR family NAD(P)-dependent oxidoreductase [Kiritimatiellia bacterium]
MKYPVPGKTVVVTGCSTGIGRAAAALLKDQGWQVVATARKDGDLESLSAEGFFAVKLDTADAGSVARAADEILDRLGGTVGVVVNNAGFGQVGAIEDLSRELLDYQFQVNVIGMQDFTNRLLPAMRRQGYGRIINISSVLGQVSLPYLGVYSASKFAMEALSDALRVELRGTGIAVSLVEPGPIATAFGENAAGRAEATLNADRTAHRAYYEAELRQRKMSGIRPARFTLGPEAVARKILHAASSPRPRIRYPVTLPAYLGLIVRRFAPARVIDAIMAKKVTRTQGK